MAVEKLAVRQHALITHDQARQAGFSMRQIGVRIDSGQWVRVVRGVYRIGGAPVTWQQTALAACLAGPPGTRASHFTAAALRGLGPAAPLPHVIVPKSASARLPIARVHRADLEPGDHDCLFGVPCTSVARTLLDCASMLGDRALASMVDDALCRRLTTVEALVPPEKVQGQRGAARLRPRARGLGGWYRARKSGGDPAAPAAPCMGISGAGASAHCVRQPRPLPGQARPGVARAPHRHRVRLGPVAQPPSVGARREPACSSRADGLGAPARRQVGRPRRRATIPRRARADVARETRRSVCVKRPHR